MLAGGYWKPVSHFETNHPGLAKVLTASRITQHANLLELHSRWGLPSFMTAMPDVFRHDLHRHGVGGPVPTLQPACH
jgi:hypothetical protein